MSTSTMVQLIVDWIEYLTIIVRKAFLNFVKCHLPLKTTALKGSDSDCVYVIVLNLQIISVDQSRLLIRVDASQSSIIIVGFDFRILVLCVLMLKHQLL